MGFFKYNGCNNVYFLKLVSIFILFIGLFEFVYFYYVFVIGWFIVISMFVDLFIYLIVYGYYRLFIVFWFFKYLGIY